VTPVRSFSLGSARRITALLALLLSVLCVTNAWQTLSVGRWHKPGAAIFPIALGALLAISGLSVLFERRGSDGAMPATFTLPAGSDLRRLLLLLAAFALYFLMMPVIGNMVASALFLFASMWLLSDDPGRSPLRLAAYAIAIALCFEWFFVRLLKVQMPGGVFRQWLF
jgi:nitrate reductase gamma subunit